MPNGQASTELNFALLEIGMCLTLILSYILKHIPSNTAVKHDVEALKGYGEALRPAKFDCFR